MASSTFSHLLQAYISILFSPSPTLQVCRSAKLSTATRSVTLRANLWWRPWSVSPSDVAVGKVWHHLCTTASFHWERSWRFAILIFCFKFSHFVILHQVVVCDHFYVKWALLSLLKICQSVLCFFFFFIIQGCNYSIEGFYFLEDIFNGGTASLSKM